MLPYEIEKKVTVNASFKLAHTSDCYVKADREMLSSNYKSTMDFSSITAYKSKKVTQLKSNVQLG